MNVKGIGTVGVNPYSLQANKLGNLKSSYKSSADKLEISSEAKEMQQGLTIPAERQERVNQFKLEVENGTYALNPKATAQGLIDFYLKH